MRRSAAPRRRSSTADASAADAEASAALLDRLAAAGPAALDDEPLDFAPTAFAAAAVCRACAGSARRLEAVAACARASDWAEAAAFEPREDVAAQRVALYAALGRYGAAEALADAAGPSLRVLRGGAAHAGAAKDAPPAPYLRGVLDRVGAARAGSRRRRRDAAQVVTECLRACRRYARRARRGGGGGDAAALADVADFAAAAPAAAAAGVPGLRAPLLRSDGGAAAVEALLALGRRGDALDVLDGMRTRRPGYPRAREPAFAAVLRDLALDGASGHAFEDVFLAMANDGLAPTAASLDALLAAPGHPVHVSIVQRLFNQHGARPSVDLFLENVLGFHLENGDDDEARRAAYVLDQLWPLDGDDAPLSRDALAAAFEERGSAFF